MTWCPNKGHERALLAQAVYTLWEGSRGGPFFPNLDLLFPQEGID